MFDTLEAHQGRALSTPVNQGNQSLGKAIAALNALRTGPFNSKVLPDEEAVRFYMLNHAMALVGQKVGPSDPLGNYAPVVERYYRVVTPMATRMLTYMMWITTREARHMKSSACEDLANGELSQMFGPEVGEFFMNMAGSEGHIAEKLVNATPHTTVARYVSALSYIFKKPKWNGSFGGPKWGTVSDCLLAYVTGKTSAEAMLDTAFTLAHNNGPIFNKGYIYHHHTNAFIKILDIQAEGMIPQWVRDNGHHDVVTNEVVADWGLCSEVLPEFHEPFTGVAFTSKKSKHAPVYHVSDTYLKANKENTFQPDPNTKVKIIKESAAMKKVDADVVKATATAFQALSNTAKKTAQSIEETTFSVSPSKKIQFKPKKKG